MNENIHKHPQLVRIVERIEKNIQDEYYEDACRAMHDSVEYMINSMVTINSADTEKSLLSYIKILEEQQVLPKQSIENLHTILQFTNIKSGLGYIPKRDETISTKELLYIEIGNYLIDYSGRKVVISSDNSNKGNFNWKSPVLITLSSLAILMIVLIIMFVSRIFSFQRNVFNTVGSGFELFNNVFDGIMSTVEEEINYSRTSDNDLSEIVKKEIMNFSQDAFNEKTLHVGDIDEPLATVWNDNEQYKVYSSDEDVVRVTSKGQVIAIGVGEAYVVYITIEDIAYTYHYIVE